MRPGGPGANPPRDGGIQTGKAVALIVIVVLAGWLVLKHVPKASHAATTATTHRAVTTPSTVPRPTTTTTLVPAASIKVQVLNGTGRGNLAGLWTTKLKASSGYQTLLPDDSTSIVAASAIYVITPGYLAEANALAAAVGLAATAVNPTIPAPPTAPIKASERATANLVLVVGPDLAGRA